MNLAVVLVCPRNPLNIGAAARAMSNLGFLDLRLVQPYDVAWREARSAVGAAAVLQAARVFETLGEAVADCTLVVGTGSLGRREPSHPVRRLEQGGRLLRKHMAQQGKAALVFGSEKHGLSNDDLSWCHWLIRIPTRAEHESMNLGQAVAVCLYELVRLPDAARAKPSRKAAATSAEVARIEEVTLRLLRDAGFLKEPVDASMLLKVRRLLRRLSFSSEDAALWLGMLRQVEWRLKQLKSKGVPADS